MQHDAEQKTARARKVIEDAVEILRELRQISTVSAYEILVQAAADDDCGVRDAAELVLRTSRRPGDAG
jgi:AmiR/NasT family two-component response regulator